MKTWIGIDPGMKGALVALDEDGGVQKLPMPLIGKDLDIWAIGDWVSDGDVSVVALEKINFAVFGKFKGQHKKVRQFGQLEGMLQALKVPHILVTPIQWKKKVLAGLDWKSNKGCSVTYAERRFPAVDLRRTGRSRTPSVDIADALCLAVYAKQVDG